MYVYCNIRKLIALIPLVVNGTAQVSLVEKMLELNTGN